MDFEVAGPTLCPDRANQLVDLFRGAICVLQDLRRAGDFREDPALRVDVLHLVVDAGDARFGDTRAAGYDEQRNLLRVGARDRIHDIVATRSIGDTDHSQRSGATRVAVRRESDGGLVRKGDDFEIPRAAEAVKET